MDRENDYYGPRGFHALMEHHPAASDYFHSLPKDVQDQLLRRGRVAHAGVAVVPEVLLQRVAAELL